jgi:hypothetical protein
MPIIRTSGPVCREDLEALIASAEAGVASAEATLFAARELLEEFDSATEAGGIVYAGDAEGFDLEALSARPHPDTTN